MQLATHFIDDFLKCSFCERRFTKIIKVVSECGSSICGVCYEELIDQMMKSSDYYCRECNEPHTLPNNGLRNNTTLIKILDCQSESNSQQICKLLLQDIQEKVDNLGSISVEEEVNAFCLSLAKQVTLAVDEAFNHLNRLGNELLEKINNYREDLLRPSCRETKRFKCSEIDPTRSQPYQKSSSTTKIELAKLSKEIDQFSNDVSSTNDKDPLGKISNFNSRINELRHRLKQETFNGTIMRFKPNELFCTNNNLCGEMVFDDLSNKKPPSNEAIALEDDANKEQENHRFQLARNISAHSLWVRQVLFLPDGNLASCSDDKKIKVWNSSTGDMLFELSYLKIIFCIAALSGDLLVSGSNDNRILIWNLKTGMLVRALEGHANAVFSLQVLPSGYLVSCSWDDTIRIWNPYLPSDNLITVITGHGISNASELCVSPNGCMIACSSDKEASDKSGVEKNSSIIRAWNSRGDLVKSLPTESGASSAVLVLKNERVAIGFLCGQVKIFDLDMKKKTLTIEKCHEGRVFSLAESPNGCLLTGGSLRDPTIKIWNWKTGSLIQAIATGHTQHPFNRLFKRRTAICHRVLR